MSNPRATADGRIVFTFPGQGAYDRALLGALYQRHAEFREAFELTDAVTQRALGVAFLPLVEADSEAAHDEHLATLPDLDQVGIFLSSVLVARLVEARGLTPAAVSGQSFGELAALAVAGVYDLETGLKIVCQRVAALRSLAVRGGMAAVSCGPGRCEELLRAAGCSASEISGINHARQTVVSGPEDELLTLRDRMAQAGVSLTVLKSRYPFHSSALEPARRLYRASLIGHRYAAPRTPVFLCTEHAWLEDDVDLAALLPSHFVRRHDFRGVIDRLLDEGYRRFVECGAGDIVSKLIERNAGKDSGVLTLPIVPRGGGLEDGLARLAELIESGELAAAPAAAPAPEAARQSSAVAALSERLLRVEALVRESAEMVGELAAGAGAEPGSGDTGESVAASPSPPPQPLERRFPEPAPADVPIAIVAMGCVLPGAANAAEYWRNMLDGVSGIVDLTEVDPHAENDFIAGGVDEQGKVSVVSDKTYTLLNGSIIEAPYDAALLGEVYGHEEFEGLTKGQKILALALAQSLDSLASSRSGIDPARIQCLLGATADGSAEYDEALFAQGLEELLVEEPSPLRRSLATALSREMGFRGLAADDLTQHRIYSATVERMLGAPVETFVLDSACSSSLYSINLGMRALQDGDADLIFAGGVFAPGPANNTLFAQFRGLTPHASRPFDKRADGVVFGDGAALVALKRLPDALAAGDRVLAVVRGMGLSSDGKSPSINVPQARGQCLAMRKAYAGAGVRAETIQYMEAHATATPVGDAEEFASLREVMSGRPADLPPIELGSVKALIGHTGWVSGVASVIKLCLAFEQRRVPPQHNYSEPNPKIALEGSPFTLSTEAHDWPANVDGLPMRAGVNGFGFGGTNAHLILEAFDRGYHQRLAESGGWRRRQRGMLAVVGMSRIATAAGAGASRQRFDRKGLKLPAKKIILPDVAESMDPTHYLSAMTAEEILGSLPELGPEWRREIGVVLGMESKTERGVQANARVFLDRLRRVAGGLDDGIAVADRDREIERLMATVRERNIPSGPYTLPGLMPNVAASRITHLFNLHGPNVVVDRGAGSLLQALQVASQFLVYGDCRMVLAGAVNAFGGGDPSHDEAAILLALTTPEAARELGVPVLCHLELAALPGEGDLAEVAAGDYRGATGVDEIERAVRRVADGGTAWLRAGAIGPSRLVVGFHGRPAASAAPPQAMEPVAMAASAAVAPAPPGPTPQAAAPASARPSARPPARSGTYEYVQETPIYTRTPVLCAEPATAGATEWAGRRVLFLIDRPELWPRLVEAGSALGLASSRAVVPAGVELAGALTVDLTADAAARESVEALTATAFDCIVAVQDLSATAPAALLERPFGEVTGLLDLLFTVARHAYPGIAAGAVDLGVLLLGGATSAGPLKAETGLLAGLVKSLARELPEGRSRAVTTGDADLAAGLGRLAVEWAQPGPPETIWLGERRHVHRLAPVEPLARPGAALVGPESVVLATGGGRGVTAVLTEELLERYGCTVIGLGRTDLSNAPAEVVEMDEAEFLEFEPVFYRREMARGGAKIADLRRRYQSLQAANELNAVIRRLEAMPGAFHYESVDINDEVAIRQLVERIFARHGRLDLVVHGAGVQKSQILTKKSLDEFRRIVGTKIASLGHIYRAVEERRGAATRPHYHLLTSAFSYLGNDGQPDYGAANEAMNRLAENLEGASPGTHWSSLAWLGWAGIGMTRGKEFAALAANRRLRGVTRDEGRALFGDLLSGPPAAAANVLMADGEIAFYQTALTEEAPVRPAVPSPSPVAPASRRSKLVLPQEFSLDNAPYLEDHVVRGVPTLPGAFIIGLAASAARELRPDLKVVSFENTRFLRFVKVFPGKSTQVRAVAESVQGAEITGEDEELVRVQILSDFVHASGAVLRKDILQTEIFVRMAPAVRHATHNNGAAPVGGRRLPDPYVMEGSPVRLDGQFNSMQGLVVGDSTRQADFQLLDWKYPESPYQQMIANVIMVDAFWRFGTVQPTPRRSLAVYVPESCRVMRVFFDYADYQAVAVSRRIQFSGVNPTEEGPLLRVGPIHASDPEGRLMLEVEGGVCRKFGEVENAF